MNAIILHWCIQRFIRRWLLWIAPGIPFTQGESARMINIAIYKHIDKTLEGDYEAYNVHSVWTQTSNLNFTTCLGL